VCVSVALKDGLLNSGERTCFGVICLQVLDGKLLKAPVDNLLSHLVKILRRTLIGQISAGGFPEPSSLQFFLVIDLSLLSLAFAHLFGFVFPLSIVICGRGRCFVGFIRIIWGFHRVEIGVIFHVVVLLNDCVV